jgi:hypothetical protein
LAVLSAAALLILYGFPSSVLAQTVGRQQLRGHVLREAASATRLGDFPADKTMGLVIGLPLRNSDSLQALLKDLYDPKSPRYRRYLTPAEFTSQFGPSAGDYQAVIDFARSRHLTVTATHSNRLLLEVSGTGADIGKAFHVTLGNYRREDGSSFYAPDNEPSVDLDVPLQHVSGLDNYSRPLRSSGQRALAPGEFQKRRAARAAGQASPGAQDGSDAGLYIGQDLRNAYAPGVTLNGSGQSVALVEFEAYYPADINEYENIAEEYGLPTPTAQVVPVTVAGGETVQDGTGEVSLDIEMVLSMAPGLSQVLVYEGSNSDFQPLLVLSQIATDDLAKQVSSSWYWTGGTDTNIQNIFNQFAAQGQSFFEASMDSGAYMAGDPMSTPPHPMDEVSNMTVVGGTELATGANETWQSESTWNNASEKSTGYAASGGGICGSLQIPSYQAAVPNLAANKGSTTQRNIPDVSMVADYFFTVSNDGGTYDSWGTSAAAPLWAAFMALANQQAAAQGLPPVGFANPALYAIGTGPQYASDFHDIADGSTNNWNYSGVVVEPYQALSGYDLATGWGSPTGQNLINDLAGYSSRPTNSPTPSPTPGTQTPTLSPTPTITYGIVCVSLGTSPTFTPTFTPTVGGYWGNQSAASSASTFTFNNNLYQVAQRFTARQSDLITSVKLYFTISTGSPSLIASIQGDSGGLPNGNIQCGFSTPVTIKANSWNQFNFSNPPQLIAGQVYHIVIQRGSTGAVLSPTLYATMWTYTSPANGLYPYDQVRDPAFSSLQYTGTGWTAAGTQPIFEVNDSFGISQGDTSGSLYPYLISAGGYASEYFTVAANPVTLASVGAYVNLVGVPIDNLYWDILNTSTNLTAAGGGGILGSSANISTSFAWVDQPVTPFVLSPGTYRFLLKSPGSAYPAYYEWESLSQGQITVLNSTEIALGYGGTSAYAALSANAGVTWGMLGIPYRDDLPFRFLQGALFTPTFTPDPTATASWTATATPSNTVTNSPTGTLTPLTDTPTNSATATPSLTSTPDSTDTPSGTPSSTASNSPTATASSTPSLTSTPDPTNTPSTTPTSTSSLTATPDPTDTPSSTASPTASSSPTATASSTPSLTATPDPTDTPSSTPTSTATTTNTTTNSPTSTASLTATNSPTATSTATNSTTYSPTLTASFTPTLTLSATPTKSSTNSPTRTQTLTSTSTPSLTRTFTPTVTATRSSTSTNTITKTLTRTPTKTPSGTPTRTPTRTLTLTPTKTKTATPTKTPTPRGGVAPLSAGERETITPTPTPTPLASHLALYPNPWRGSGGIQVHLGFQAVQDVRVRIYSVAFHKVRDQEFPRVPPGGEIAMEVLDDQGNPLANGLYYVMVTTSAGTGEAEGNRWTLKLLVLR